MRIRLRELRASRGLTQEQLCESAGVSVDAVNRIESGTRVPTIATLASLATALGVEVGDLVRTEAMPPARFKPPVQRIVAQLASQPEEIQDAAEKLVRVLVLSPGVELAEHVEACGRAASWGVRTDLRRSRSTSGVNHWRLASG